MIIGVGAQIIESISIENNIKMGAVCICVQYILDNVIVVMNKLRIIVGK